MLLLDEPLGALDLKLRKPPPGRAQAHPDRGRDHVRVRDPRPGGGAHDERPDRGHERAARSSSSGTPEELYERPATRFVADFIGTTNLLAGTVERPTAGRGRPARLGRPCRDRGATGRRRRARSSSASGRSRSRSPTARGRARRGACAARVEQAAYLGTPVQYHVRTGGRPGADRPRPQDRGHGSRSGSRRRAHLAARPTRSSSATGPAEHWRSSA